MRFPSPACTEEPTSVAFPDALAASIPWLLAIARHAAEDPARPAVICGAETITYGDLIGRANQLAAELHASGIGSGHFIGIGLQRSAALVPALLGIIKSGAAYVPLDPTYPPARIAEMLASAKLGTVVTETRHANLFGGARIISIDALSATSEANIPWTTKPEDLIYAIFTSGSTGTPKAAAVYHRGFDNLLDWYISELGLRSTDRTLVISSPSFDLTQKNFYAPLAAGGTLILDEGQTYDISRITALIRNHSVTLVNCTPSAFQPLVEAAATEHFAALASLRFAVLGGEPISLPRIHDWLVHPNCHAEIVNSYGPTECTDICAFHRLHRGNLDEFSFVPLGREIPNTQVTIRDADFAVLPDRETGELCISGAGIGKGYLYDSQRTADAFVGHIYRTGDLARRLPCGVLEFRGRADHQVKINGHRIELGDIETALQSHYDVQEAIVTATDNRLVAHIRGNTTAAALRSYLTAQLPGYMVPGEFQFLDAFPRTPNGKIDRLMLASPKIPATTIAASTGGSLETQILALWSEILDRPINDPNANFFDLGGDSIHLAVVHVRLTEMSGRAFEITELFALPSARAIAGFLAPTGPVASATSTQSRARQSQAAFSRFRPTSNR